MGTILALFAVTTIITIIIIYILVIIMKSYPKLATYLETVGYVLLAISLAWTFLFSSIDNMSNETDMYVINEKLDTLWRANSKLQKALSNDDFTNLDDYTYELHSYWYRIEEDTKYFREQVSIAKIISAILLGFSTLLIACGRGQELLISLTSKKNE
ncbi:hypothetical protein ACE1TH_13815 [Shouchella sp. JSM 1781072]|uniref:hypothetical protein n=1 Tax=Shouchella sp. JSM 1781072 TaxID=3344581 RepID=UPI0035BEEAE9